MTLPAQLLWPTGIVNRICHCCNRLRKCGRSVCWNLYAPIYIFLGIALTPHHCLMRYCNGTGSASGIVSVLHRLAVGSQIWKAFFSIVPTNICFSTQRNNAFMFSSCHFFFFVVLKRFGKTVGLLVNQSALSIPDVWPEAIVLNDVLHDKHSKTFRLY